MSIKHPSFFALFKLKLIILFTAISFFSFSTAVAQVDFTIEDANKGEKSGIEAELEAEESFTTEDLSLDSAPSNDNTTLSTPELVIDERDDEPAGTIQVEEAYDYDRPYKERRTKWGALFSVSSERFEPLDYVSILQNKTFEELTDASGINLLNIEIGVKYNFSLGSISALIGGNYGTFSNEPQMLVEITTQTLKADMNIAFDNIFSEPYLVPYAQAGLHQMTFTETSIVGAEELTDTLISNIGYHLKAGMLFQLDWIERWFDSRTGPEGRRTSGLENTFVDVFYTYNNTEANSEEDPLIPDSGGSAILTSSGIGVGLKLEF